MRTFHIVCRFFLLHSCIGFTVGLFNKISGEWLTQSVTVVLIKKQNIWHMRTFQLVCRLCRFSLLHKAVDKAYLFKEIFTLKDARESFRLWTTAFECGKDIGQSPESSSGCRGSRAGIRTGSTGTTAATLGTFGTRPWRRCCSCCCFRSMNDKLANFKELFYCQFELLAP